MNKINIAIQYFSDCPHASEMIENVKKAITGFEDLIVYSEILIEDNNTAVRLGFRGSPTLLINEEDFEGLEKPEFPGLSCRFYMNGVPTPYDISKKINDLIH